jgi:hypothetical protein
MPSEPPPPPSDEIEALMRDTMKALADRISFDLERSDCGHFGFALVLFEKNDGRGGPGWVTYCSNGEPRDIADALRQIAGELIARERRRV